MYELLVINTSDDVVAIHVLPIVGNDWWVNLEKDELLTISQYDEILNILEIEDFVSVTAIVPNYFEGPIVGFSNTEEVDWMEEGF